MMEYDIENSINQQINLPSHFGVELFIKREDRIHPFVSGNKFRKLKYNLLEAKKQEKETLLTFGGAFSNHIAAVASAGNNMGYSTIGVIRGDELENKTTQNPTLNFAKQNGMQLKFLPRGMYREKHTDAIQDILKEKFGDFYLIPEGGTNLLAVEGCEEILTDKDKEFDFVCCPVGTGGTVSGLINCSNPNQKVLGFPALKGRFLQEDISKFATKSNWTLVSDYHFGGYAKINKELITFINRFKSRYNIPLDPVYTGKMLFGILDLIDKNYFPKGSKILAIHTGGLQGIAGMNALLKKKNLPIINK